MTTPPRWVRPALAAVLAIALGAGGALIGSRFAPTVENVASRVIQAEVAQELPLKLVPQEAADLSPQFAEEIALADPPMTAVVLGSDPVAEEARLEALVDALSLEADPIAAAPSLFELYGLEPPIDICAGTEPPAGCPGGVPSTVLRGGVGATPPPRIVVANAATTTEGGIGAQCEAETGRSDVIAVVSTVPGTVVVNYWQDGGNSLRTHRVSADTSAASAARWEEESRGLDPRDPAWPTVTTCIPMYENPYTGGGVWEAHASLTRGTESTYFPFIFNGSSEPQRPPATFDNITNDGGTGGRVTYADDIIIVSVPHEPGEAATVSAHVFFADERPECATAGRPGDGFVRQIGDTRLTSRNSSSLIELNVLPQFTELSTTAFEINEGTNVLFCVEVLPADGGTPTYTAWGTARTADRPLPVVSLHSVSIDLNDPAKRLTVQGYLANGQRCGTWTSSSDVVSTVFNPTSTLCNYSIRSGSAGATLTEEGPASSGVFGNFTLALDDNLADAAATAITFDVGWRDRRPSCSGSCPLPADAYYPLLWSDPGRDAHATIIAKVSWIEGNANGAIRTTVSRGGDSRTGPAPYPQLDTGRAQLVLGDDNTSAHISVSADRAARFEAKLVAAPGSGPLCQEPGAVFTREGELGVLAGGWTTPAELEFTGLCAGGTYQTEISLYAQNEDGTRDYATWGPFVSDSIGAAYAGDWVGNLVAVPRLATSFNIQYTITGSNDRPALTSLAMNGTAILGPNAPVCISPGAVRVAATLTPTVAVGEVIRLTGSLAPAAGELCGDRRPLSGVVPTTFQVTFTLDDISNHPDGLLIQVPRDERVGITGDHNRLSAEILIRFNA